MGGVTREREREKNITQRLRLGGWRGELIHDSSLVCGVWLNTSGGGANVC